MSVFTDLSLLKSQLADVRIGQCAGVRVHGVHAATPVLGAGATALGPAHHEGAAHPALCARPARRGRCPSQEPTEATVVDSPLQLDTPPMTCTDSSPVTAL